VSGAAMTRERCPWCGADPLYVAYHDHEWGVPVHDDRALFEFLVLEGAQAGLAWITILRKREGYRRAFAGFDAKKVARFDDAKVAELLTDPGIVRNRLKVESAVTNARAFLEVQARFGAFDRYIWGFVDGQPIQNQWRELGEVPALTPLAERISKDLKTRGFRFVGPTIVYAHMQATGMVNDHLVSCFRHREVAALSS
jgi:DNA-3-methyladenine glycosylase I